MCARAGYVEDKLFYYKNKYRHYGVQFVCFSNVPNGDLNSGQHVLTVIGHMTRSFQSFSSFSVCVTTHKHMPYTHASVCHTIVHVAIIDTAVHIIISASRSQSVPFPLANEHICLFSRKHVSVCMLAISVSLHQRIKLHTSTTNTTAAFVSLATTL